MSKNDKPIHGGRNLLILGFGAFAIALITTTISMYIYRSTGDIFLDRSRPGYISEDEKHHAEDDIKETFANEGEIDAAAIDEYIRELDVITGRINAASGDFSLEPISDETLNIEEKPELEEEPNL